MWLTHIIRVPLLSLMGANPALLDGSVRCAIAGGTGSTSFVCKIVSTDALIVGLRLLVRIGSKKLGPAEIQASAQKTSFPQVTIFFEPFVIRAPLLHVDDTITTGHRTN